ncbi:MAG: phosphatase PAP2 family protein [Chloroflexota bacterium]
MPADATIFAAKYLVFIELIVALAVVAYVLSRRSRLEMLSWAVAGGITLILSEVFAQIGSAVYNDPRPFYVHHFHPLIAHAADNGFPSDHALLAAALVVFVVLIRSWVAVLIVILAVLVDWARVGAGVHQVADVVGSSAFVAVAALIAVLLTPLIVRWASPYLPPALTSTVSEPASSPTPDRRFGR